MLSLTKHETVAAFFLVGVIVLGHATELLIKTVPAVRQSLDVVQREVLFPHVDLNRAGVEELDAVPYISRTLAWRIVLYRRDHGPFRHIDDLRKVEGGGRFFRKIERYLTVNQGRKAR